MKIYIIMEGDIIRCVTASLAIAEGIFKAFSSCLNLKIHEHTLISDNN